MTGPNASLNAAVIIPTKGRAEIVCRLIDHINRQTSRPDVIIVAACEPDDVAGISQSDPALRLVFSTPGLPRQRNTALAVLPAFVDIAIFFDDDFIPSRFWIEHARDIFARNSDVASVTGRVLADGIKTPGIPWAAGVDIVARADALPRRLPDTIEDRSSPYGCNMAFRMSAISGMTFDERLVLYGWQEDTDFGARAGRHGRVVWTPALWGVHLGIKRGRVPGRKLGYSQIVNPRYLVAKGTMSPRAAIRLAARNITANVVRSLRPEPYIDRAGRLRGNLLGLWDLVTGRWKPERAAEL
ncbi:MAG: glycosyltransferase family 2 protein [Rhizobiales bacterium]|nr:glycosyltransferase family 2 protein [Hyphomicrobiales bacterium]